MAAFVSRATGNFTSTSTWKTTEAGTRAQQFTHSASTNTTTSAVYNANAQDITITNLSVIEGIMLFCNRVNTTGTVTVTLSADSGTTATRTVTVNASDLPAQPSWVFFEFGSTLTGDGGTDYAIAIHGSSAGNATFFRDGTTANWSHVIVTNQNPGSIAAGDQFFIVGELISAGSGNDFTVTMDSTATTDYGTGTAGTSENGVTIGKRGVLTWGTTAATNYYLKLSGSLALWGGATMNMGTTGTPVPRDSTAVLEFDPAADGDFGLNINTGATCNIQGLSRTSGKNVSFCRINTDEAATSTTIGVDTDTGWKSGDVVCFAPTGTTATEFESKTLNADAGASSFVLTAGLTYGHLGTSPRNGEVGLLTRNVKIRSATSTLMAYVNIGAVTTVDIDWAEFRYIGTNTSAKRGIEVGTGAGGSFSINHCSIYDGEMVALYLTGNSTEVISITNMVIYNMNSGATANVGMIYVSHSGTAAGFSCTITDIMITGIGGTQGWGVRLPNHAGTYARWYISGANGSSSAGVLFPSATTAITTNWLTDVEIHAIAASASQAGALVCSSGDHMWDSITVYDCARTYGHSTLSSYDVVRILMKDCNFINSTTHDWDVGSVLTKMQVDAENCVFGSSTEVTNQNGLVDIPPFKAYIKSTRHDQTDGNHKSWFKYGTIQSDSTASMYRTASPSERMTPNNASAKLESGSKFVAVASGQTVDISVYVRESVVGDGTDYNGARPRLILKANPAMGLATDTVIDTATASAEGAFEQLTGTTSAAARDGVFEFVVDCDGTTGWVNVDDWSAT